MEFLTLQKPSLASAVRSRKTGSRVSCFAYFLIGVAFFTQTQQAACASKSPSSAPSSPTPKEYTSPTYESRSAHERMLIEEIHKLKAQQNAGRGKGSSAIILITSLAILGIVAFTAQQGLEAYRAKLEKSFSEQERIAMLDKQLSSVETQKTELSTENGTLRDQVAQAEREIEKLKATQLSLDALKDENGRLKENLDELQRRYDALSDDYGERVAEAQANRLLVSELRETADTLRLKIDGLQAVVATLERSSVSLELDYSEVLKKKQLLEVERAALLCRVGSLLNQMPQAEDRHVAVVLDSAELLEIKPIEFFVSQAQIFPGDNLAMRELMRFVHRTFDARERALMDSSSLLRVVFKGLHSIAAAPEDGKYVLGRVSNSQQGYLVANDVKFKIEGVVREERGSIQLLVTLLSRSLEQSKLRSTTMRMVISVQSIRGSSEAAVKRLVEGATKSMESCMRSETRVANDLEGKISENVHAVYDCGVDSAILLGALGPDAEGGVLIEVDGQKYVMHSQVLLKEASFGTVKEAMVGASKLGVEAPSLHTKEFVARKIVSTLAQFHGKGMVHGRVSLDSFQITTEGEVLLSGIEAGNEVRREGVYGSGHLAPEVVLDMASRKGRWRASTHADSWASGVALFELFTGTLPYTNSAGQSLVERLDNQDASVASSLTLFAEAMQPVRVLRAAGVNEDWVHIIGCLLEPNKKLRPTLQQVAQGYSHLFAFAPEEEIHLAPPVGENLRESSQDASIDGIFTATLAHVYNPDISEAEKTSSVDGMDGNDQEGKSAARHGEAD